MIRLRAVDQAGERGGLHKFPPLALVASSMPMVRKVK